MMQSLIMKMNPIKIINKSQKYMILNTLLIRSNSIWNKDWKPGPYPRTEEQKKAAALKYGLEPSEYQPYPDDGTGHGDYPKLPDISTEGKDPFYLWDFPESRRNLNDTIHVEQDMYGADRYYIDQKLRVPLSQAFLSFIIVMGLFYITYEIFDLMPMFRPVKAKQYPNDDTTHYTFDLEQKVYYYS